LRGHGLTLQKAAFIVKPHLTARNVRLAFTFHSLGRIKGRTSHYATSIDSKQPSELKRGNKTLIPW